MIIIKSYDIKHRVSNANVYGAFNTA